MPEARGGSRECQAATVQEQLRGATPRLRPGVAAGRSNPMSKEQPHVQGAVAVRAQEGLGEPFHVQDQEGRR